MDCGNVSERASDMLKHFAHHAVVDNTNFLIGETSKHKKGTVPDLYPISTFKGLSNSSNMIDFTTRSLSPLGYCEATLEEPDDPTNVSVNTQCSGEQILQVKDKCQNPNLPRKQKSSPVKSPNLFSAGNDKVKLRKQQKCSIRRKCTKFIVQSNTNSLLCST